MTGYQPKWEDGKEVGTGLRDCAGRYDAIKRYLTKRMADPNVRQLVDPTVLEVGAYNGYFCHRLHDDFNAKCLAVDDRPFLTARPGTNVLHKLITPEEITGLGAFDIVLCLSVLHHHGNWGEFLRAMSDSATVLFLELAHPDEHLNNDARTFTFAANRIMRASGAEVIAQTPPMGAERPLRPLYVWDKGDPGPESIEGAS